MNKNIILSMLTIIFLMITVDVCRITALADENQNHGKISRISLRRYFEKRKLSKDLDKIKEIIVNDKYTSTDIIRKTMEFVYNNSVHSETSKSVSDIPFAINKLLLTYQDSDNEKPYLSCGPRSYAMKIILDHLGITSRLIQIYSDQFEIVRGHRMLEVFNPETKSWEVWDPDYRVTYIDRKSKKRLDIMAIVFGDIDQIIPQDGVLMGWDITDTKILKLNYFKAVLFERYRNGMQNSIIVINRNKFNLEKIYSDGLTFKDWAVKHYQHPRFIILPYNKENESKQLN